jgi:hypothetical protein
MIETKIPPSIQEILDEFIRYNFFEISYKRLANALNKNVDTVIQRVSRNKKYFKIDDSKRPSKISIKKGIEDIYYYRDNNICKICQKQVSPNELELRFRNPYQKNKYDWNNVLSVCDECKDKEIVKIIKKIKLKTEVEYKEVHMRWTSIQDSELKKWEPFLEFDELDGTGYFPLLDENKNIASNTIADVLNYFSANGWEMINIEYPTILTDYESVGDIEVLFKRNKLKG